MSSDIRLIRMALAGLLRSDNVEMNEESRSALDVALAVAWIAMGAETVTEEHNASISLLAPLLRSYCDMLAGYQVSVQVARIDRPRQAIRRRPWRHRSGDLVN